MYLSELNSEIRTGYQKGFQWFVKENIWFIGYFYNQQDEYLTGPMLLIILLKKLDLMISGNFW